MTDSDWTVGSAALTIWADLLKVSLAVVNHSQPVQISHDAYRPDICPQTNTTKHSPRCSHLPGVLAPIQSRTCYSQRS